jgi:hypothetical protein
MLLTDIAQKMNVKYSSVQYILTAFRKYGHTNRSCNYKEKLALQNMFIKKWSKQSTKAVCKDDDSTKGDEHSNDHENLGTNSSVCDQLNESDQSSTTGQESSRQPSHGTKSAHCPLTFCEADNDFTLPKLQLNRA